MRRWLGVSHAAMKDGFKFMDYFSSVLREDEPLLMGSCELEKVAKQARLRHLPLSREKLLEVCPFASSRFEDRLKSVAVNDLA